MLWHAQLASSGPVHPVDVAALLSKFPGTTAKGLALFATHVRISRWSFGLADKTARCDDFRLVIPDKEKAEEAVLKIELLEANWTDYKRPTVDFEITRPSIDINIDDVTQRSKFAGTNWHRLIRSGFPPKFSGKPPRLRRIQCRGT
jgi:hypothetical protein